MPNRTYVPFERVPVTKAELAAAVQEAGRTLPRPRIVMTEEREQLLQDLAQRTARELREPTPHLFEPSMEFEFVRSEVENPRDTNELRDIWFGGGAAASEAQVDVRPDEDALDDLEVSAN